MHRLGPALAIAAALGLAGCHKPQASSAPDSGTAAAPPQLPEAVDERPRPNYDLAGPRDPLAERLCAALWDLPASKRADCCHTSGAPSLAPTCAGLLSAALRGGALRLDPTDAESCIAALRARYATCDAVDVNPAPPPAVCASAVRGTLAAGRSCRSSLECVAPLRCQGAGPLATGVCGPPRPPGGACRTAVDGLAPLLQLDLDRLRPECSGPCDHHTCRPPLAAGAACSVSQSCGAGSRCAAGKCVTGAVGALGEACSGDDCAGDLRCILGVCAAPRPSGAACSRPEECLGTCARDGGSGTCAPRCR